MFSLPSPFFLYPRDLEEKLASERPVVVMARGHSGTRVLTRALGHLGVEMGSGPDKASADVGDERFARTLKSLARKTLRLPPDARPDPARLAEFRRRAWRYRKRLDDRSGGWGWKLPETYMLGNFVAATFPHARLVHMLRDGRDVAFKWHRTDRADQRLGRRLLEHLDALDEPHHVQAALSWEFQVRRFQRFARSFHDPVHRIKFEELVTDPVPAVEGVAEFLGIEMTGACRDYLVRTVDPAKRAQYRFRPPDAVAEIEAAVGPTLRALGYPEPELPPGGNDPPGGNEGSVA